MIRIISLALLILTVAALFSCQDQSKVKNTQLTNPNDTPTEAYKRLFAAVKKKDVEAIKNEFSAKTKEFAKAVATRQNVPLEKVFSNGFTSSTFSDQLPEIRDERIKDDMGAIEVWNSGENRWEDLPFVRESDGWKLAIGELFSGTYKSPGKGKSVIDQEAINAMSGNKSVQNGQMPANLNNPPAANARPANK
ncbi:MAG: hypothetical protein KIT61_03390 [Pyrinomonadaceae bacterium]|nr:hypothetical protein [Blastocatellia bacterium]MCW5955603.1 hypothetical protein [Pyrinomonadaceae bacterium]